MKKLLLALLLILSLTSSASAEDYSLKPLGAHPSPITATVQQDTVVDEDFPAEFTLPLLPFVLDQDGYGMCVSYSLRAVLDMQAVADGDFHSHSAAFIYGNRKVTDYQGEGMYPYQALANLQTDGACLDSEFPARNEYPVLRKMITDKMRVSAAQHRIDSSRHLYTPDEVKSCLIHTGAVSIMIPVYDEFYDVRDSGILPMPDTTVTPNGYHEMTICGWRNIGGVEYWRVLNSWGGGWAYSGYCFMPLDYPVIEMWEVAVKAPEPLPEPEPLPAVPSVTISEIDFTLTVDAVNVECPVYQWWLRDLSGSWYCVRDYGPDATITLSELPAGDYEVVVYVKEQAAGWETAKYQVLENRLYLH
ncbi:MAG: hypothetical protein M0R80_13560 [Proteobacteria bacterium]|jgi:hypothetical protein|nr:hypothetical protein [Pseudomonadota bacterium]